ncbi:MAG: MFS transporter [Alphaproteobacteria bacterium]|nr:MFS transporter [Alphaproteobacteria bacterium]
MIASYLTIIRRYPVVIAFGFLATFFSNFGQTYFIGLYGEYFQTAFELSNVEFGGIYSAITLASAVALLALGHVVDKVRLRPYVAYVCLALAAGCMCIAFATSLPMFIVGLWLVRFHGQGVITHMASTVTAREIEVGRGKSLSLTALGQPLGEVVLPLLFTFVLVALHWQDAWLAFGIMYICCALPLMLWLTPSKALELPDALEVATQAQTKLRHLLRDPALWLLLVANMLMPFLITGITFHQKWVMEDLGFTLQLYAISLMVFGVGHAVAGLLAGDVVDRLGAVKVLRWFLLPFMVASLLLAMIGHPVMLPIFMLATALSAGCTHSARGSYLAERYGVKQLGAIKSLFSSAMVFSTALAPVIFGMLIDGFQSATILFHLYWISAAMVLVSLRFLPSGKFSS